MIKRRVQTTYGLAVLLTGLAACGNDDQQRGADPSGAPAAPAAVTLREVTIEKGKTRVRERQVTRAFIQQMNAHRARLQAGLREPIAELAATVDGPCSDDRTLWLNDGPNQEPETTRICIMSDGTQPDDDWYMLIDCPESDPRSVYQVKSFWQGIQRMRLFNVLWTDGCGILDTRTLRDQCVRFHRVDDFGPPFPSHATVFNQICP